MISKAFISALIAVIIVPLTLTAFSSETTSDSINDFRMNIAKKPCLIVGGIGAAFFGLCLYGSTTAGQTGPMTTGVFGLLFICCAVILLLPARNFYDNEVYDDALHSHRWFVVHKELPISEIDHCVVKFNEMGGSVRVYQKGKDRAFCWLDLYQNNVENFLKRMEAENIPIEENIKE